ncbi:hypothetical protein FRC14_003035 [Serendipita sp. 396]|nr:hypothetical protein FRC14_003035 [Serendipita sp. 396]KAG8776621.1 hypothetical protein FRC16_004472 [Serendipita sp. 398]KAG8778728.1 hypothetical protein FRC15_010598 [Serendipita sp. 397]KAG8864172.1 hypothetical protein FRC20_010334 [Serendipita sp. 405]
MSIAIIYRLNTSSTAQTEPGIHPPRDLAKYTKGLDRLDEFMQNQQEHDICYAANFNMEFISGDRHDIMSNELGLRRALMGCWKVLVHGRRYENICWRSWSHRLAGHSNLDSSGLRSRNEDYERMEQTESDTPALSLSQTLRRRNEQADEAVSASRSVLESIQGGSNSATGATTGHSHHSDLAPKVYSIGLFKAIDKVFTNKDVPPDKCECEEDSEMDGVQSGPVRATSLGLTASMELSGPEESSCNLVNSVGSLALDEVAHASEPDEMVHILPEELPSEEPWEMLRTPFRVTEPIPGNGAGPASDFQNTPWRRAQRDEQIPRPDADIDPVVLGPSPVQLPTFRQLLHERMQKHNLDIQFIDGFTGPENDRLWFANARLGYEVLGVSTYERSKAQARESAARWALNTLESRGYY